MSAGAHRLPHLLRVVADAAGADAALRLARTFGGQYIYIPKAAANNHPLVLAGGRAAAEALIKAAGGENIDFPGASAARSMIAVDVLLNGGSLNEAAKASGLSNTSAKRLRREIKKGEVRFGPGRAPKTRVRDMRQLDIDDFLTPGK